jgi:hypothetical protein
VPDPDQTGEDSFEYTMSDCAFNPKRQPTSAAVRINILPVADAPFTLTLTLSELETYRDGDGISVDLQKLVTDPDMEAHVFAITSLLGSVTARINGSNVHITWPAGFDPDVGFRLHYSATDPSGLAAAGLVAFTPDCRSGLFLRGDAQKCELCPPGLASSATGSTACSACGAGCSHICTRAPMRIALAIVLTVLPNLAEPARSNLTGGIAQPTVRNAVRAATRRSWAVWESGGTGAYEMH